MLSPYLGLPPAPDWEVLGPWPVGCCTWAGWGAAGPATEKSWVVVTTAQVLCGCLGRMDTAAYCFEGVFRLGLKKLWKKQWLACLHVTYQGFFFLLRHTFPNIFFLLYWQWYPCKECYCMVEYQGTINIVKYNFVSQHSHGLYANKALLKCHLLICRGCTFADRPAIELGPWEFSQYLL